MRNATHVTNYLFFDPRLETKCEPKRNKGSGDVTLTLMEMFDFSYNLLIALTEKEKK